MSELPENPIQAPDYELIAESYDQRYRNGVLDGVRHRIRSCMREVSPGRWLEAGCGTGQWLREIPTEIKPFGLDQSRGMLAIAADKLDGVPLIQSGAGSLPIADGTFQGIATIHALHHFPDQDHFLQEAYRALSPEGGLLIINMDVQDPDLEWYVYDFFEGVVERDRLRFPRFDRLISRLQDLGFTAIEKGIAHQVDERVSGEAIFQDPFLSRRGNSQMALLSDREYQQGLDRVQEALNQDPDHVFTTYVPLAYLWAVK